MRRAARRGKEEKPREKRSYLPVRETHVRKTHRQQPRPQKGDKLLKWWISSPCKPWASGIHKGFPSPQEHLLFTGVCHQSASAHRVWFTENTTGRPRLLGLCIWNEQRSSPVLTESPCWHLRACMHGDAAGKARTGIARNSHILIHVLFIWDSRFFTIQTLSTEPTAPSASFCFQCKSKLLSLGIRNLPRDMQVHRPSQGAPQSPCKWEALSSQLK